jgi:hypothetical protein
MGRGSVVGIVTGYGLDDREVGVRVPVGSRIFSTSPKPAVGSTQPMGTLGVKRPGCEADHSPLANAEVKKMWIIHPLPIRLRGVVLKHRDNFTFTVQARSPDQ